MVVASQQQIYQLNYPAQLSQASTKTHTFSLRIKVLSQQLRHARDLVVPPPGGGQCGAICLHVGFGFTIVNHWSDPESDLLYVL